MYSHYVFQVFDDIIFVFFGMEMTIKMIAMGIYGKNTYLADSWNRLDFFIVLAGALEYCLQVENLNLTAIRTIRVLRPLRAINRIPSEFKEYYDSACAWWFIHFSQFEYSKPPSPFLRISQAVTAQSKDTRGIIIKRETELKQRRALIQHIFLVPRYADIGDAPAGYLAHARQCAVAVLLRVLHFWHRGSSAVGRHPATEMLSGAARLRGRPKVSTGRGDEGFPS